MSKDLLRAIFNHDFSDIANAAAFHSLFFTRIIGAAELRMICEHVCAQSVDAGARTVPCAMRIPGNTHDRPCAIIAQLHGNEPAGLAGILLAMALSAAGLLERDIIAVIGNPLAAQQYFDALAYAPHARQETRDAYRCGVSPEGALYPDMNRIPVDFLTRSAEHEPNGHHTKRAQELHAIGQMVRGVLDIHTARGNMLCITDYKKESELKDSPIRSVLTGLAEAISAHASAGVKVQTLKTVYGTLFDLDDQTGIEAGRHEAPESPYNAASFTLSWLHTLGLTTVTPIYTRENGIFTGYHVRPRITYSELKYGEGLRADDMVYMAKACQSLASVPNRCDTVIVRVSEGAFALQSVADFTRKPAGSMEYCVYQYDEMEAVEQDQVVAVALPSGTEFKAPFAFSGIFVSKSAALYDKDPSVGPWPVAAAHVGDIKFCYPCDVAPMTVRFS